MTNPDAQQDTDENQVVIMQVRGKFKTEERDRGDRLSDARQTLGPVRQAVPVVQNNPGHFAKTQRYDREIIASQSQRGISNAKSKEHRDSHRSQRAEWKRPAVNRQERRGVS